MLPGQATTGWATSPNQTELNVFLTESCFEKNNSQFWQRILERLADNILAQNPVEVLKLRSSPLSLSNYPVDEPHVTVYIENDTLKVSVPFRPSVKLQRRLNVLKEEVLEYTALDVCFHYENKKSKGV